MEMNMRLIMI